MNMETIQLQPRYLRLAIQMFLMFFAFFFFTKLLRYGFFSCSETWLVLRARAIEALVATVGYSISLAIIFPLKHRNVILTQKTLRAPMKSKGYGWMKATTVDLSEIVISRALIDRLCGAQLATNDGKIIHINSIFYPASTVRKLVDEIELRQKLMKQTA